MHKFSSIIIAKNEEANIARAISSLQSCIDEIILVIDSSSFDATKEIAEKFDKVKIFICDWKGYAQTKQYAVDQTSNDWIFWIDADEAMTVELQSELNELKQKNLTFDCYNVARRAYFLGRWIKHSGWYPSRVARFFNKKKVIFNNNEVHESLSGFSSLGKLKNDLLHFTDPSIEHYYEKFNRYTSLAAKEMFEKNKSVSVVDLIFRPIFIFIKMYLFRFGFLDGLEGLILAIFSSNYVFTKYCKLRELKRNERKPI